MKFDVVISSPPYRSITGHWGKHIDKHLHLLKDESYYGLLSAMSTKSPRIFDICKSKSFNVVMSANYNKYIEGLDYKPRNQDVTCFIWKKKT